MRTPHALMIAVCVSGCATYRDDLNRGQQFYEQNHYAEALATWRALQWDMDALDPPDQARYAYLRGMTDYRLGFRADARHWLAFADAVDRQNPTGLTEPWRQRMNEALAELNSEVWKVTPAEAMALNESRANGVWPADADTTAAHENVKNTGIQTATSGAEAGGATGSAP